MPGPGRDLEIRLYRDSLTTPWGFRLSGGKDLKAPLTIQKVTVGTPVFGELHKDDVILEIQNCDASRLTHKQAQDMIRNSGGSMLVRVRRCGLMDTAPTPVYDQFGGVPRASMLGRVRNTLSSVAPDYSSGYGSNSFSDYGDVYSPTSSHASADSGGRQTWNLPMKPSWRSVPNNTELDLPGWTPRTLQTAPRQHVVNVVHHQQPQHAAVPHHRQYPHPPPIRHIEEPPAWFGSLRSATEPKISDRKVGVGLHHSASPEPIQHHHPTQSGTSWLASQPELPGGAMHLQYNSPIGLYSKSSAQEAVYGSTADDEAALAKDVHRPTHDDYLRPDHGDEVIRQSPSIRLLESRFVHGEGHEGSGEGISDF